MMEMIKAGFCVLFTASILLVGSACQAQAGKPLSQTEALDAADAQVKAALANLEQARKKLETGREPLPGERVGLRDGKSRLTDAYFKRIGRLEKAVKQAESRLDRAYRARSDAKGN